MIGRELKKALAARERGRCAFCRRAVPKGRTMCTRDACARTYQRLWHRDNRPRVNLRAVVERIPSPTNAGSVIEVLECGHILKTYRTRHAEARRRRCPSCVTVP